MGVINFKNISEPKKKCPSSTSSIEYDKININTQL